ncbi:MAG: hypothetical protein N2484_07000 [Clostridia bacterium]|nr:hypothetical protein [Clostridia bacterium]
MKSKMITSALFKFSNIGTLLSGLLVSYMLVNGLIGVDIKGYETIPFSASVGLYILCVILSLTSNKFHEKFNYKQKLKLLRSMDRESSRLASSARKHLFQPYNQKLKKVIDTKNEIVDSYFRGEKSYLKEKITEQTLKLALAYVRLVVNYCMRAKDLKQADVGEIMERINMNARKMSFAKDPHTADDIKKVIEMDENLISRLKNERVELERINAKLEYMEGTVSMFKHQILSNVESEEMLEKLETAVNEVSALDTVLQERQKNRMRM